MSLDQYKTSFLALISLSLNGPALALVLGFPETVCQGLGVDYEVWNQSSSSRFGLYMYTATDVALGLFTAYAALTKQNVNAALAAIAVHQLTYLSAALPAFGYKNQHAGSIVTAILTGVWAWSGFKAKSD